MSAPLYHEIAESLRRQIDSGVLHRGDRLPTEDELMQQHGVSRSTARAAARELKDQGLVETLHGKGSYVAHRVEPVTTTLTLDPAGSGTGGGEGRFYDAEVARTGRSSSVGAFRLQIEQARPWLAGKLMIAAGTDIIGRHERRFVDGIPWSLQTSYYPRELAESAPALADPRPMDVGTVAYLRDHGIDQVGYRDSIEMRPPYQIEREFFGLQNGRSVLVVEHSRVAFSHHQRPMRLTITVYLADRNRFVIEVGEVPPPTSVTS
jgi:GntR family transcriptional regulator